MIAAGRGSSITLMFLVTCLALGATGVARAQGVARPASSALDYTYLEGGFLAYDYSDGLDVNGNGWKVDGSFDAAERVNVFGSIADAGLDRGVDATDWQFGGGYHFPLAPNLDVLGTVSYLNRDIDPPGPGHFRDDGLGLGVGLRGRFSEPFEWNGKISAADLGGGGWNTILDLGARYALTPMLSLAASASFDDHVNSYFIGVRFYPGGR